MGRFVIFWSIIRISQMTFIFLMNFLIPDHIPSEDVLRFPIPSPSHSSSSSSSSSFISSLFYAFYSSFNKWDSAHFLSIVRDGYSSEQSFAFFPLYPLLVRFFTPIIFFNSFSSSASSILTAVILSNIAFLLSALVLYLLLQHLIRPHNENEHTLRKKDDALILLEEEEEEEDSFAALLFSLNPASLFFISPYSESAFSLFSFTAILLYHRKNYMTSSLFFFLASATRFNGVFNICFPLCLGLQRLYLLSCHHHRYIKKYISSYLYHIVCGMMLPSLAIILPFVLLNLTLRSRICHSKPLIAFGIDLWTNFTQNGLLINSTDSKALLCEAEGYNYNLYSILQRKYWNVGLFRYYQLRKTPNFLLAAPILFISLQACRSFFQPWLLVWSRKDGDGKRFHALRGLLLYPNFAHIVHLMVSVIVLVLYAHIEISTRLLLSSSPYLYMYMARQILQEKKNEKSQTLSLIIAYFISYNTLAALLHPNAYPWT